MNLFESDVDDDKSIVSHGLSVTGVVVVGENVRNMLDGVSS